MALDLKLTQEQQKQMTGFMKPRQETKPMNSKEKIGDKSPRTLPIRGR